MRTVSVVLTYYNRPDQLRFTLRSLRMFYGVNLPDIQVVIVDDGSSPQLRAQRILNEEKFQATLIEIDQSEKNWVNPCVPYNRGFAASTGDIIFIQNSESLHMGPVINQARAMVDKGTYVVFPCYATTQQQLHQIIQCGKQDETNWFSCIRQIIEPTKQNMWYHHPQYAPTWYHFASAISRENFNRIGGFDERFSAGYCFEDNNFLFRIRRMGLTIPVVNPGQGYVVHLWHPKNPDLYGGCPLWEKNRQLQNAIQEGRLPLLDPNQNLKECL